MNVLLMFYFIISEYYFMGLFTLCIVSNCNLIADLFLAIYSNLLRSFNYLAEKPDLGIDYILLRIVE